MSRLASAVGRASRSKKAEIPGGQSSGGERHRIRPMGSLVGDELQEKGCGLS